MSQVEAPIPAPESFNYTGNQAIPERWWTTFEDGQLNRLIDTAFTKNLNPASIWELAQKIGWDFYVLPTFRLDNYERSQSSITINSLRKLTEPKKYSELKTKIEKAYNEQKNVW